MYRTCRLAIGVNARVGNVISRKLKLEIRFDFDYRFIGKDTRILTTEVCCKKELATIIYAYLVSNPTFNSMGIRTDFGSQKQVVAMFYQMKMVKLEWVLRQHSSAINNLVNISDGMRVDIVNINNNKR